MHKVRLVIKTHIVTAHYDISDCTYEPTVVLKSFSTTGFLAHWNKHKEGFVNLVGSKLHSVIEETIKDASDCVVVYMESYEGEL